MTTRALLLCDGAPAPPGQSDPDQIRERIDWRSPSANVNFRAENLDDTVLGEIDGRAADLIQIATCTFAADQAISRGGDRDVYGSDWHRELHLAVPVRDPDFWSSPEVYRLLLDALEFATGDTWRFTFSTTADRSRQLVLIPGHQGFARPPDYVVLFSGGADSLCATVELLAGAQGRPLLISHRSTPPTVSRQTNLARILQGRFPERAPSHTSFWIHRKRSNPKDTSQRTRAFLFASLGAAAAAQLKLPRVIYSDNGVVSLNLPINRGIVGTMASRSTHPGFLSRFNRLLGAVFQRPVRVENTLALRTRAEALQILKANSCADLLQETVSCSHTRGLSGMQPHCGYCTQCIDRRFGSLAADMEEHDLTERYKLDAFVASLPEGEQRTIAVSYVRFANRLSQMTPEEMFQDIPELAEAINPESQTVDADARAMAEMLKRHGLAVGNVMSRMAQKVINDLGHGRLPQTCLLRLAFGGEIEQWPALQQTAERIDPNCFRREGKMWRVRFDGREVVVPDEAGMVYLFHLLSTPERDVDVVALLSLRSAPRRQRRPSDAETADLQPGGRTAEPIMPPKDRARLRQRLKELAAARSVAEQAGNDVELALIDKEVAEIERELERTTGRGGKPRTFQDERGKARQSVSRAIDRARKTIRDAHMPLGRHLHVFIKTGWSCSYRPVPPIRWSS